jgi:hypothetical protein
MDRVNEFNQICHKNIFAKKYKRFSRRILNMRLRTIYSWTIPLLFHNMFSHAVYKYIVRRSIQSTTLDFTRHRLVPMAQDKMQNTIQENAKQYHAAYHTMQPGPPPKCHTCKYFKPILYKGDVEIGKYYGTCKLFTKIDPITHINDPLFTHEARKSESYCGKEGRYYSLHPVFQK